MKSIAKLCFVTPEIGNNFEEWKLLIQKVIEGGVEMIQIRDKRCSKEKLYESIKKVQPYFKKANVRMIINDHVDIAHALKADGVHLGHSDMKVDQARTILGNKVLIGLSIGTIEQAIQSRNEKVNYLSASPVFFTESKDKCAKPWGIPGLKELNNITPHPLFAIGGINFNNLEEVLSCGISGVAIVSAISKAKCPKLATQEFLLRMRKYASSFN